MFGNEVVRMQGKCYNCQSDIQMEKEVNILDFAPRVRCGLRPTSDIQVWKFTSQDMAKFIFEKSKMYIPNVRMEVVAIYCEKKRRKHHEPHRSYASLLVSFSDDILSRDSNLGWYGRIGEDSTNLRIEESLFGNIVQKYQFDKKTIDKWLKSYKNMDELEEKLGINEAYIEQIRKFATPRRIQTNERDENGKPVSWIVFSASAENVIADMLTDVDSGKVPGKMIIQDVRQISNEHVEYTVYMHPAESVGMENPHVRQLLFGETKK